MLTSRVAERGLVVIGFLAVALGVGRAASGASQPASLPAWASAGVVAYRCDSGLCLMRPDGSGNRHLLRNGPGPHGPGPQWDPALSPDGRMLALRGDYGAEDGEYALYVAGTNGCGVRRLTRSIASDPSWSPDGKWIAFDTSGAGEIWKVRPDGSGLTRIANPGRSHFYYQDHPAWSPTGRLIAFARYYHNRGEIWLMRPDGSSKTLLYSDPRASDETPAWSLDGERIAFVARVGQQSRIETVSVNGSNPRTLTPADAWNPVWLPHDTGIAFLASAAGLINGTGDLYVVNPDGKSVHKIANLATEQFAWADAPLPQQSC